jgi:hypothetical protein
MHRRVQTLHDVESSNGFWKHRDAGDVGRSDLRFRCGVPAGEGAGPDAFNVDVRVTCGQEKQYRSEAPRAGRARLLNGYRRAHSCLHSEVQASLDVIADEDLTLGARSRANFAGYALIATVELATAVINVEGVDAKRSHR